MPITTTLQIEKTGGHDLLSHPRTGFRQKMREFAEELAAATQGSGGAGRAYTVRRGVIRAGGTLTLSGASGTVGGVINGVTLTDTYATSDTVTAGLVATAIRASTNALIQNVVTASNVAGTLTLSGTAINSTATVCGFVFRAVGGTAGSAGEFDVSGNDTADAAALAAAINKHPVLSDFVWATSSSGVVTVFFIGATPTAVDNSLAGSGITAGAATLAAGAVVGVVSMYRGLPGNWVTLAASGTGVTASGARLAGGTNTTSTTV